MKTQLISELKAKYAKILAEKGDVQADSLDRALERSAHELTLLAKYYQKHGYLRQAQEIYYYILSIQERRDRRSQPLKEGERRNAKQEPACDKGREAIARCAGEAQLKRIAMTSAYGMCTLKRS